MLTNQICARPICIPQSSSQVLSCLEILLDFPGQLSGPLLGQSFIFFTLLKIPRQPLFVSLTEDNLTFHFRKNKKQKQKTKTEIQPISRKVLLLKDEAQEFPLWRNRVSDVSAAPGHRFNPRPSMVG